MISANLTKEKSTLHVFFCWTLLLSVSGYITYAQNAEFSPWVYITVVLHCLLGISFIIPLYRYCHAHIKRVIGSARPLAFLLGLVSLASVLYLWGSGIHIITLGNTEQNHWIADSHRLVALSLPIIILIHIIQSLFKKNKRTAKIHREASYTLHRAQLISGVRVLAYGVLFIVVCSVLYSYTYTPATLTETSPLQSYTQNYGTNPFRPSQSETPQNHFVNVNAIANSRKCGNCHNEIYQQWSASAHRRAASDLAYVKNIHLLESRQGIEATRYCEGCHAPVALLSGQLTSGGKHGGVADTPAFHEGVGCMGCHGLTSAVHVEGVASYRFTPTDSYLFEHDENKILQLLHNFLIRVKPEEHKTSRNSNFLKSSEMCATCHEQFMDKSMNQWGWVKMQSIYSDWLNSGYSHRSEKIQQTASQQRCQDCHFPPISANDPSANSQGKIKSHYSLGANTVLPWVAGDDAHLERTRDFLESGKITVTIDKPIRSDALQSGQFLSETTRPASNDQSYFFYYPGEQATLRITASNRGVGHGFPGGTSDINQAWLSVTVIDAGLNTVFQSGYLNSDGTVDSSAHFYHSVPIDRKGKEVWKHDLFRMTGVSYKNLLEANSSDIVDYQFRIPAWVQSPITISVSLNYRKFNQRYANWVFDPQKPNLPIIEMARDSLTIPILEKRIVLPSSN